MGRDLHKLIIKHLFNLSGQAEISCREAPLAVRGEGEFHLIPADCDIWVVINFLGLFGDFVDKTHGLREVCEFQ